MVGQQYSRLEVSIMKNFTFSVLRTKLCFGAILIFLLLYTLFIVDQTYGRSFLYKLSLSNSSSFSDPILPPDSGKHATKIESQLHVTYADKVSSDIPSPSSDHINEEGVPDEAVWTFNTTRDEKLHGLSEDQCDAAFPGLYMEIERAVNYRKRVGSITIEDVDISWKDDGVVRAIIIDQQV